MSAYTESPRYRRCQAIFDRTYPNFRDAGQRYADRIAAALTEETRLLDVGCGRTSLAADVMQQAQARIGIDLSFSDLQHNTSMHAVAMADAAHLPFPDAHFDLLVSQWVVEHFVEPEAAFTEMARVLRPDGRLVLLTTNANNYIPLVSRLVPDGLQRFMIEKLLRRPSHESFPTTYRANTRRAIQRIASRTGFEVESLEFVGNPFYMAFNVLAFRVAMLYERMTDWRPLNGFKLYIVATLRRI
ncbi:MAG: class I SAM-dependent methyltransferase [Chloroflexi bacterium]|nr:MAG: class I SAM-dependent methyltransferase [Chloroflexota bacterium]